jgi:hypothetical protein
MKALVLSLMSVTVLPGEFRAAAVKVDITPTSPQWLLGYAPRKSAGTHDPIYHRVLALDDGRTQFYLVATDLCLFSPTLYDEVAADLKRRMSIEPKQFWWAVSHTHSAPEVGPRGVYDALLKGRSAHEWDREYTKQVASSLISAVEQARSKLQPARTQVGVGRSMANINRRAKDVDGRVSLGLNPDGPVDRQIGLIRFDRLDGSPIALIANYAIHGTVLGGQSELISGDAPGVAAAYVEEKIGAPVLFINGAAGDTAPIYSVYRDPKSGHLSQFRVLLGDRILEGNSRLAPGSADVTLRLDETYMESPLKTGLSWPTELAKYSRSEAGTTYIRLPIRFLTIGDTAIWAAPVELFSEVAIHIRNLSPFTHTFYFGYTNGWFGYLPTAAGFAEGGYEPNTSVFTSKVEDDLVRHVSTFLDGVRR